MKRAIILAVAVLILLTVVPAPNEARVVRFVVDTTRRVADGKNFGNVGPYERLDGTVYIELDPRAPLNAVVFNLDKAPKTPKGMVGFSTPFFILKPVDLARGNRKIFYGVNNRGNKLDYTWRALPQQTGLNNNNNPLTATDFGDALLSRLGYTYVDAGWQGNVAPGNRLVPDLPVPPRRTGVRSSRESASSTPMPRGSQGLSRAARISERTSLPHLTPRNQRSRFATVSTVPGRRSRPADGHSAALRRGRQASFRQRRTSACSMASSPITFTN